MSGYDHDDPKSDGWREPIVTPWWEQANRDPKESN